MRKETCFYERRGLVVIQTCFLVKKCHCGSYALAALVVLPYAHRYAAVMFSHGCLTGTPDVMFRSSTDGGQTYNDKINLSNSSNADSTDAAISAEGGSITVTWWETNETSEEPLVRTSTDFGESFGPIMNLATNGTIGEEGE
jgi:hypothetical protein